MNGEEKLFNKVKEDEEKAEIEIEKVNKTIPEYNVNLNSNDNNTNEKINENKDNNECYEDNQSQEEDEENFNDQESDKTIQNDCLSSGKGNNSNKKKKFDFPGQEIEQEQKQEEQKHNQISPYKENPKIEILIQQEQEQEHSEKISNNNYKEEENKQQNKNYRANIVILKSSQPKNTENSEKSFLEGSINDIIFSGVINRKDKISPKVLNAYEKFELARERKTEGKKFNTANKKEQKKDTFLMIENCSICKGKGNFGTLVGQEKKVFRLSDKGENSVKREKYFTPVKQRNSSFQFKPFSRSCGHKKNKKYEYLREFDDKFKA